MATTTPNFGWSVPTSTDLVKDGATAIETLGDAIDASLVDLKGGTSGQVLKKNSNTDMDFVWGTDSAGMTNPMTTTGDTIYSSSGSTPARLGIGTTGQVLTVAAGLPSWAAAPATSTNWTLLNAGGTALTGGGANVRSVSFTAQSSLYIYIEGASMATDEGLGLTINGDTGSNYFECGIRTTTSPAISNLVNLTSTKINLLQTNTAAGTGNAAIQIQGGKGTGVKTYESAGVGGSYTYMSMGHYFGTSAITSIDVRSAGQAFDAGTVYVYGA